MTLPLDAVIAIPTSEQEGFKRGLKERHIELIALGGVIGSCYFLGTGAVLAEVGPATFLAYLLGGVIVYFTMQCLGELAVAMPVSGSFISYAAKFVSPVVACGSGWTYWLNWVIYIPAECVAAGIIMEACTGINGYLWGICFGLLITFVNLLKVSVFGEVEFWLALIKIVALIGFIVLALAIFFGLIHGNQSSAWIGGRYLWRDGGFLPHGSWSLLSAMILMLVNYQGSEIIGMAAGESINPEKTIPKAIRQVIVRILCLYILPVFCLALIFPWQKATLIHPVFSDALNFYGLKWAAGVMSFVTLTAALSCANSGYYSTARALRALAQEGMAPHFLSKINAQGAPQNAIIITLIAIWTILIGGYCFSESTLYLALLLISGFTGTISWIVLCWAQIRFRSHWLTHGHALNDLKYKAPGSPYTGLFAIALMVFSMFMLLFDNDVLNWIAFGIGSICLCIPMLGYAYYQKFIQNPVG